MEEYIMGIDAGTSAMKITLLRTDGKKTIGTLSREIPGSFPKPAWSEQDPQEWYAILRGLMRQMFDSGKADPRQIIGIAADAATHTTVLLDERFLPVRPAIMWNDQRAAALAGRCSGGLSDRVFRITRHRPGAMWSLFQNLWVRENEPELWPRVRHMLFTKDYLRYRLTGEYCTDYIDAEGSGFYDVHRRAWSEELVRLMDFPLSQLPPIQPSVSRAGSVTASAARETGLLEGTPVLVGASDTIMELVAAGAVRKGQATVKLATSGRVCVVSDRVYPHAQLVNYSHVVDSLYYPGTGTRSCATSMKWYRDTFAPGAKDQPDCYKRIDQGAERVPAGSEGLYYHPYLLGEFTPYSNENLRASFVGASMKHTRHHFARAVMEGCCYSLRDCVALLEDLGVAVPSDVILIGGGASSPLWSGIAASVLGRVMRIPAVSDSSMGSAMLAGVGLGIFRDFTEASGLCRGESRQVQPDQEARRIYDHGFAVYKKIQAALEPVYNELQEE